MSRVFVKDSQNKGHSGNSARQLVERRRETKNQNPLFLPSTESESKTKTISFQKIPEFRITSSSKISMRQFSGLLKVF
ncbi:hypothetical protein C5167_036294 [Papaver somniferum]|nr:hypothetical protein C5167_036294 [Papaver somniferum]